MDLETSRGLFGDDDVATQLMIEQSLLQRHKQSQIKSSVSGDARRIIQISPEREKIFNAIKHGDENALRKLAVHQHAFSEEDDTGFVPLHEAAIQNNQNILQITFTASPEDAKHRKTHRGMTALFLAVEKGLLDNACFLLDNGSSPDSLDKEEDSPLVVDLFIPTAIRNNHYDMTKLLLNFSARVNQEGAHRRTALHEAARLGLTDFVDLLLKYGAHPDARSSYGLTPLALAAQAGHLEIIRMLLRRGADVESQAQDSATILFEASASGNPDVISLLLEYGADANVPKHTGHLPIHRVAHRGHVKALALLIPVTTWEAVDDSGISPLHSAAAGGHTQCLEMLLKAGYDPNFMLHPWVRRSYDDKRQSALYFAVSNDDIASTRVLLEAGAMPNQDPVKCLQVALRLGNYELINMLLRYGANVNYFCRVNTTHFPSALQYALKDEVVLRMLCNYGYDVERCFDCPYGEGSHVPDGYEGWSDTVIKDTLFCEVICVSWLKHLTGNVVRIMLDYVDHLTFCSKLKAVLMEQKQWAEICKIQENVRCLQHLCRLKIRACLGRLRLRAPIFMSFLPLPDRLKQYILYREYDLYSQKCQTQSK
ncbi:dynein axonemal heavy chain 12 isoform X1 [Ctenopharyngodon idella]|uniref:dynein axonemal heavy chain 12 isoform X1 n=1 Tax=Ctenopharyngodon idella TaxID=7959 RepID=UPI00222F7F03|nr:dynein axonemal heavy chain 12 isoform X1 [Ctenopharyngodon idella]XP_051769271.1 dynein axonemal heavy chain 12 isoform X1 [Ctenopharyngodon idella]XP_051769272.1 dynein axonemal heavy chain 12 isoform X1 [Ctenopharyngodon idella]XP_051769273.1 dynein axonemal heavy chain 12 isoform X1 [Ctenopharyngodon idella]XP_051769274.1 dynein axonemal heavy chain 12 isoform X1 [Ctenopharyngodon idella]XP_051769275.1 dynein axonemal heavy chain 12 isoform X1 [Ctenopharyngodon idella]XP_051769276.1 dy